ncbi:hypothetical protein D8W71_07195 [Rhodococcus sp. P1Y]|nr:hypothetical protein D8W71_07195 [Rhodococcus sp. P1Y]
MVGAAEDEVVVELVVVDVVVVVLLSSLPHADRVSNAIAAQAVSHRFMGVPSDDRKLGARRTL